MEEETQNGRVVRTELVKLGREGLEGEMCPRETCAAWVEDDEA